MQGALDSWRPLIRIEMLTFSSKKVPPFKGTLRLIGLGTRSRVGLIVWNVSHPPNDHRLINQDQRPPTTFPRKWTQSQSLWQPQDGVSLTLDVLIIDELLSPMG